LKLPLLVSVPHAGLRVPPEAVSYCTLTEDEIKKDGDEYADEIYAIESEVAEFVTTDVARAIVDLNRAEDDRRKDGVIKTHTCWDVPVYKIPLPEDVAATLLECYYHPFHTRVKELSRSGVRLGVDCHTMAAKGPPVGPDTGIERPPICLSNADGTCPPDWFESLAKCLEESFQLPVNLNAPFKGGYIIRSHAAELPWVQLELSRAPFLDVEDKRKAVIRTLKEWCK